MRTALNVLRLAYGVESVYIPRMLSLSEALKTGRIAEFIAQEEQRGVGPASRRKLDAAIKRLATKPLKVED